MELLFPSISVLFAFLLFMFMVVKVFKRFKAKNPTAKLPPGPWQLPLIGNMHQLVGSLPHHILRDLANKYGPLMHLKLGEVSTVIASSPESPKRQLRKICTIELLSPKRVQTFRSIREEEVLSLIRSISSTAKSPINFSKKIYDLTYGITARSAFGEKIEDQEAFISLMEEAFQLLGGFSIADMYPSVKVLSVISGLRPRLEKMHKKIDQILENIINQHKKGEKTTKHEVEDLVDVLLKFRKHGDLEFTLTDNNIKAVILDIFSAGSDTSSTAVEWAMSEMLRNPRVMKRAQAEVREVFGKNGIVDETGLPELKYLNSVIKETLRLHPPAPLLLPRECSEQCEINGYQIPVKTRVIVNAWAIGRDPRYWTEAERFHPERFLNSPMDFKGIDFEYIPFGAGRRICPGVLFALPNIELPLAQLLYHFDWKLPTGLKEEKLDMNEAFGLTVRRRHDLYLIPIPYYPTPVE
ncbi:hypothetical protein F0562_022301 [Nyssa sinensis]|uniref:Uncharacterized protein n=1 Tax=Nyssa sinensis TaxID=561372 RepID=A0A5J5BN58_9ASTE|nr:hypothetical protein F0562_022301 [Nyssa sinensis]